MASRRSRRWPPLIPTITSPAFGPSSRTVSIDKGSPGLCATAARTSIPSPPAAPTSQRKSEPFEEVGEAFASLTQPKLASFRLFYQSANLLNTRQSLGFRHRGEAENWLRFATFFWRAIAPPPTGRPALVVVRHARARDGRSARIRLFILLADCSPMIYRPDRLAVNPGRLAPTSAVRCLTLLVTRAICLQWSNGGVACARDSCATPRQPCPRSSTMLHGARRRSSRGTGSPRRS
jgi:hypothetical protein